MKKTNLFDEAQNEPAVITSPMATVSSPTGGMNPEVTLALLQK
jgi:hypothetical protein